MCQIMRGIVANPMMLPMLEENSLFPFNPSLDDEIQRLFDVPVRKQLPTVDEVMEEFRLNGRDFEYCPDVDTDTSKQTASRRKKNKKPLPTECVFCRNNGEEESFYREHLLKDVDGRILCPVLRAYTCPICGVSGDLAHTVKYCPRGPYNPNTISTANAFKSMRNSTGKRRSKKDCSRGKQSIERIRFLLTEGVPTSASANETTNFVCENERM